MKTIVSLLFAYLGLAAAIECDSDSISCRDEEKCIPLSFLCDSGADCDDSSDEVPELCDAWQNVECSKTRVTCERNGDSSCVHISSYCSFQDPPCEGDLDRRLCLMLEGGKLDHLDTFVFPPLISVGNLNTSEQLAERFRELIPNTLRHKDCPPMYTLVGDQCLSIFHIGSMNWEESREFCRILGGDLMTFRNVTQYATVVQHLNRYEISSNFWIGGSIEDENQGWTWVDNSPVELGTPFWATRYSTSCVERNVTVAESEEVCYHYHQAPEAGINGSCLSLSFEQFFYMADNDCVSRMSPLCVYLGEFSKKE